MSKPVLSLVYRSIKIFLPILFGLCLAWLAQACRPQLPSGQEAPTLSLAAPTPSETREIPTDTSVPAPTPTPWVEPSTTPIGDRLSPDEVASLYRQWNVDQAPELETGQAITLTEITPAEVWQRLQAQVFTVQDENLIDKHTFLVRDGQIWLLGTGVDGQEVEAGDLTVSDLNGNGKPELIYIFSTGSGSQRLSRVGLLWWEEESDGRTLYADYADEADLDLNKIDDRTIQVLRKGETQALGELALLTGLRLSLVPHQDYAPQTAVYTSQKFGVSFQYPASWKEVGEDHYTGEDGFFEITAYESIASSLPAWELALDVVRACDWEVNLEPGKYGLQPQVNLLSIDRYVARCLIVPGLDAREKRAALLFQTPAGEFAILHTDAPHLAMISQTFQFHFPGGQFPKRARRPFAGPEGVPAELKLESRQAGALTLEEWSLFPEELHTPLDPEYVQNVLADVLPRRAKWRVPAVPWAGPARLAHDNALLAPFGYRIESESTPEGEKLRVMKGDALIREGTSLWWPAVAFQKWDGAPDFALVLQEMNGAALIRNGSAEPWDMDQHFWLGPVVIGGRLATLDWDRRDGASRVLVNLDGKIVYSFVSSLRQPGELLLIDLDGWGEGWALEVFGTLVVNGKLVNPELGYGEIFAWELLDGKPVFFFEKGGKFGISYDGRELPVRYDEILHNECCASGVLNPNVNDRMAWFYARRDGKWFYVELGIYE